MARDSPLHAFRATTTFPSFSQSIPMQAEYSDEISGDMQERQRILLEQEIMRDIAEGSILDSVSNHSHEYSVEHPRRDPHSPGAFDEFRSFAAHSADVSRHEEYAPFPDHRLVEMSYSFRPNDDSAAVGETMSTAQHHASAVTLGAGLGGFRRSPGRSGLGGEFDPDREVNALLDGRGDISYFDDTQQSARRQTGPPSANNRRPTRPSPAKSTGLSMRSKYSYAPEPLIVEDTAALDRALETGRFRHPDPEPMPSVQRPRIGSRTDFNSHSPSSSSSDASGFERSEPGSPRLGHASREITTQQQQQQQRRRSTKIAPGPSQSAQTLSVTATRRGGSPRALSPTSLMPPPRKAQDTSAVTVNISHTSRMPAAPESLFDATIRSEALKTDPTAGRKSQFRKSALNQSRQPLNDVANRVTAGPSKSTLAPTPAKKSTPWDNGASVHLPDITGLTAAIASPNKPGISYYEPAADGSQSAADYRATIEALLTQLRNLQREHSGCRRRVHEFELDLQNTEAHQSRIEEQITQNQERGRTTPTKVARKDAVGETNWEEMYQQVVAEKQVLQQVIDSFKAKIALHAREIESKQHLIEQLQEHIEENAFEFEAKCREVVTLQAEIAKLGEEVEATRELVTMGLRERERTREERERAIVDGTMDSEMEARLEAEARGSEVGQEYGDITDEEEEARRLSAVAEEEEEEGVEQGQEQEMSLRDLGPVRRRGSPGPENEQHEATTDDEDHTARLDAPTHTYTRPVSRLGNTRPLSPSEAPSEYPSQSRVNLHASSSSSFTPKTGGAIFGSPEDPEASYRPASRATRAPSRTSGAGGRRYLDVEDLGRVQADLEERRSNRSMASSSSGSEFGGGARRRERVLERSASTPSELREVLPSASLPLPSSHLHYQQQQQQQRSQPQQQQQQLQPPRTRFARHHSSPPDINGPGPSTAAPASSSEPPFPRIRGDQLERLFFGGAEHNTQTCRACKGGAGGTHQEPAWLVGRSAAPRSGMGSARVKVHAPSEEADDEEERVYRAGVGEGDRVPPQTVLARVVRQLEDDFAHYKSIYIELADQYKIIDATGNVAKRNILAEHLKDVINTVEQKGDQIASLYDLLSFQDKPLRR